MNTILPVRHEFQPDPSLTTRDASLEAMRLLRLTLPPSLVIQGPPHSVMQGPSLASTPRELAHTSNPSSARASSIHWAAASMASSLPSVLDAPTRQQSMLATPYSLLLNPTPSTWLESPAILGPSHGTAGNRMIPYLQQQQEALNREYPSLNPLFSISPVFISSIATGALPAVLSRSTDTGILTQFQVFLRQHIEVFVATDQDVTSRIRGPHKRNSLASSGRRCRHCAHISATQCVCGAVFYPSSTKGVYQASQNMCSTHCGLCPEMPESTKKKFAQLIGTKTAKSSSAGGRAYWGRCARQMGFVDTDEGIFAVGTIPETVVLL
jgi:hypothetical protein